jgi:hypothetical protein
MQLSHAHFCCFVIITQPSSNAEAHLTHDDFESDSARIALSSWHDALN